MSTPSEENDKPIIGILAQEPYIIKDVVPKTCKSYIASSYVSFIECAGARAVPIFIGKDRKYYEDIMKHINGILFPGGGTYFTEKDGYADAGEYIYDIAKDFNDKGHYFPLWGTCLGFQLLIYLSSSRKAERLNCKNQGYTLKLDFKDDQKCSKIFKEAPDEIISTLADEAVSTFFHRYCYKTEQLKTFNLNDEWNIISVNKDTNGDDFISIIESKKYPFFGVQFHPEKPLFECPKKIPVNRSTKSLQANRYFSDFFVKECRKSNHNFENEDSEKKSLIFNYPLTYTGLKTDIFQNCYLFE